MSFDLWLILIKIFHGIPWGSGRGQGGPIRSDLGGSREDLIVANTCE